MAIKTLGIDIRKSTFHLIGLDERERPTLKQKLTRAKLMEFAAKLPPCLIGMEACPGSQYLARRFAEYGHTVRLMAAQFVKPYVKSNKSDFLDAEAIAEAVTRPTMRFVPVKNPEQQDLQALHRVRSALVAERTATINQARAFLLEYGLPITRGTRALRHTLPGIIADETNAVSFRVRSILQRLWGQILDLDQRIEDFSGEIEALGREQPACQRLMTIPGIGILTATAFIAAVGDGRVFRSGRELAAWLGLVPAQYSTGGKPKLLGISKRGNVYVRTLLVHGARAVLARGARRDARLSAWLAGLSRRAHPNVAAVALANKLARIAWAVLTRGDTYQGTTARGNAALEGTGMAA